jgi:hypothetical protein
MKRKMVALLAFSALLMIKPITAYATEELSAETWLIDIDELQEEQEENEDVLYGDAQPNPVFFEEGYDEMPEPLLNLSGSTGDKKAPTTNEKQSYAGAIAVVSCALAAIERGKINRVQRRQ